MNKLKKNIHRIKRNIFTLLNLNNRQDVFTDIYKKDGWAGSESVSGKGSDDLQTQTVIELLPVLLAKYGITSVLDIPCGDFNWMKAVELGDTHYIGADIVEELVRRNIEHHSSDKIDFQHLDLTHDSLPKVDLIFCRDCLVHLSFKDIFQALNNVCDSQSQYLLTTTFTSRKRNKNIVTGRWRTLNLMLEPFSLPRPIAIINEQCSEKRGSYSDKSLALFKIEDIRKTLNNQ